VFSECDRTVQVLILTTEGPHTTRDDLTAGFKKATSLHDWREERFDSSIEVI